RHSPAAPVAGFATPVPTGRTTGGTSRVGRSPPRGTGPVPYRAPSVQVVAQHLRTRGVAQLGHGLGLDLPDPFPGHAVDLADLVQGLGLAVGEPEAHRHHAGLAFGQGVEHRVELLLEQGEADRLARLDRLGVLDEVAELAVAV